MWGVVQGRCRHFLLLRPLKPAWILGWSKRCGWSTLFRQFASAAAAGLRGSGGVVFLLTSKIT